MADCSRAHAIIARELAGILGEGRARERASAIVHALDSEAARTPPALFRPDDIVRIKPGSRTFAGCLLIIEEVLPEGVYGYVPRPMGNTAHLKFRFSEVEHTGGVAPGASAPHAAGAAQAGAIASAAGLA